jgi:hypothetical protein
MVIFVDFEHVVLESEPAADVWSEEIRASVHAHSACGIEHAIAGIVLDAKAERGSGQRQVQLIRDRRELRKILQKILRSAAVVRSLDCPVTEPRSSEDIPTNSTKPLQKHGLPFLIQPQRLAGRAHVITNAKEFISNTSGAGEKGQTVRILSQVEAPSNT